MKIKSLRNNSMSWTIVKVCIITIITSSCPCVAKSNNGTVTHKRLAILSSEEVRESGLGDLLTVEMQELPNVELVERDLLQKVLDEVALSMMLGADQVENRRQAGVLLKADMLVLLSLEEAKSKKPTVKIVISDCSNGARLRIGWIPFNKDELENSCRDLTKIVHNTLERFKDGVKQIVGVSHLVSRNLVHDYDHLQAGYAYLLQNALSSSPGVAVIEMEEARSIRHESELAGDIKSGRAVPLFVEGEFRMQRAASKKQAKVQITIRISDSVGAIKQIERKDLSMDKVAAFITDDAALTILKLSKSPSVQMLDKEQQLQALIRNADEFARLGAGEHSTGLREAAVLLKPDSTEQRIKLFDEYIQILRLRFQSSAPSWLVPNEWRPSSEHLEYVIYNRMIDRKKAMQLSSRFLTHLPSVGRWARTQSPMPEELYRKDFLRRVYPEILKLKPSSTETRDQQRECAQWHDLLASKALKGGLAHRKEGLAFFLDLHSKAVPEGVGPSSYFVRFLKRDFYSAGYKLRHNRPRYTRQEFLDFLTVLSHSEKTLSSFYGRYGLLYHKYCQRKHQGKAMDDLRDEAEQLVNEFKKAKFPLSTGHGHRVFHDEIVDLKQKMESGVGQTRLPSQTKLPNGRPPTKEKTVRAAKGRLVFEKIPMKVKDLSGNTHQTGTKRWVEQDWHWGGKSWGGWYGMRNSIRCGDSLDVMWSGGAVLFMKQKGLLEEVFVGLRPCFDHLTWDGQNIWVGTRSDGIWLVDTFGKIVAKIGTESGLPSVNKRILLHPIEPGRIFAVGSFGPHLRAWCAIVEFKKGQASVNVFHEATRVPTDTDNREELENDPTIVFEPYSIDEYQGEEENRRILLIGRDSRAKYDWKIVRRPLEIDLNKMSIRVSTGQISSLRKKSSSYFVSLFPNIEYKGKVYAPGKIWYCIDPNTHEKEKLVDLQLPEPYSLLDHYWVSAHYGLVGWNWVYGFHQIRITDDEHVYGYFHTVVFEDENGPITAPAKLKRIYVDVVHQNKIIHQYKGGEFPDSVKDGGPLLPGTYKATMWLQQGANAKRREFEPVEVTEDSPEQLVFKVKGRAEILYCGQVVNAITGKPMEGAFVTVSDIPDLSPLTHEQWIALHKLPANPYPADDALFPVHDLRDFTIERVVRTDRDGRFEMSFKVGDKAYSFAAFEEDYLSTEVTHFAFGPVKDGRVELPPMALFPAAKVNIYPCIEEYNSGKPCIEAANVNIDHWFSIDENYNPGWVSKFRKIYPRSTSRPSVAAPRLAMNEVDTYHVPAGLRFKIKLGTPINNRWCIPDIPQTINLKQGEVFELGRFVFDPLEKISVKVVNSTGSPIPDVYVKNLIQSSGRSKTGHNGVAPLYVRPSSRQEILIDFSSLYSDLRHTLLLDVSSKEKMAKGFTIVLLENGKIQYLKTLEPTESELAGFRQSEDKPHDTKTPTVPKLNKTVFTTGLDGSNSPISDLTDISINQGQIYVLTCWLLPLEYHEIVIKIFDGSGKLVKQYQKGRVPYSHHWHLWSTYRINPETDKPGKWKAEIYLGGQKMGEKHLTVLP